MLGLSLQARIFASGRPPSLGFFDSSACPDGRPRRTSLLLRYRCVARSKSFYGTIRAASNINVGAGDYEDAGQTDNHKKMVDTSANNTPFRLEKPLTRIMYLLSIAAVLLGCALAFSLVAFSKSGPSILISAIAKSGFTAAFTLIFVSEIGDKTFFIAALLAMQYDKAMGIPKGFSGGDISKVFAVSVLGADIKAVHNTFLLSVLLGSMGALSLMTILSVVIGRIFHSIPAQFQTTLPIGEYAAVALLIFFGFKTIKDAWELPSEKTSSKESPELGELVEAEELVKEKVAKKLTSPLEIIWKSFSLVFFAEWGDRSMLATIALGAAQSPWGVASGAIAGHLIATSVAALGGAFLANYISEKKVGYLGGVLFLIFAVATLFGVF